MSLIGPKHLMNDKMTRTYNPTKPARTQHAERLRRASFRCTARDGGARSGATVPALPARLPQQAVAQPRATSINFLQHPSGVAAQTVGPFLTVQERVNLAQTSVRMHREVSSSIGYQESVRFHRARQAAALAAQRCNSRSRFSSGDDDADLLQIARSELDRTCIDIVEARASRKRVHPLYPAFREARRILNQWDTVTAATLLASEQLLVEACDATNTLGLQQALALHDQIWQLQALEQQVPRNQAEIDWCLAWLHSELKVLVNNCAIDMLDDLRLPNDPPVLRSPMGNVVFISHAAGEPWTDTVDQSHTFAFSGVITQSIARPSPAEGLTRMRVRFRENAFSEARYVHVFNVQPTTMNMDMDMDQPE